ncbi:hypothetical protein [Sphingomonas pseudosanguinis]|uniref:Uncharacterized protein n=1 Tax=Sphingomonas pseudosanguinis TaxID=413712 RepID=A0A7W6F3K3_9SPHN|nr:hypothetical protein [Sphingomonas pseudosanguinis]MBB3879898.1 hypothetical protein [Sphingomonas pseudosanguinis]MBN3537371.1 hypothetical protein [Sphingomonas pseudosanguinis]
MWPLFRARLRLVEGLPPFLDIAVMPFVATMVADSADDLNREGVEHAE